MLLHPWFSTTPPLSHCYTPIPLLRIVFSIVWEYIRKMFENSEYYYTTKNISKKYELYDKMEYSVGDTVVLKNVNVYTTDRMFHNNNKGFLNLYQNEEEIFIITDKIQNNCKSPTIKDLTLRNYLYGIVKIDDPSIIHTNITIEFIKRA